MSVVVVGSSSLIAQALRAQAPVDGWRWLGHREALDSHAWLTADLRVVINCAFDPRLARGPYDAALDLDLELARRLRAHPQAHLVVLSSRLAYGPAGAAMVLSEAQACSPDRPYGQSKLQIERAVAAELGGRATLLRLANVFGDEDLPGRQNFFSIALRTLREHGRIQLDMSPFVARDFIPVQDVAAALLRVSAKPVAGLFNLGSGHATPTGRIAQWLIEGRGGGELRVVDVREHDAFQLDVSRFRQTFGLPEIGADRLRDCCRELGRVVALRSAQ